MKKECEHEFERHRVPVIADNPKFSGDWQFYFIVSVCKLCDLTRYIDMERE